MTYSQKIGTAYEYFVLDNIKKDFEQVWHWRDFPEKLMFENNLIKNYETFCKYRYDIGADLVAFKNNTYYFIQCKNFTETILMENLAGFYFLLYEYGLKGIIYYSGKMSQRVLDLMTEKVKIINLPFNNLSVTHIENIEIPLTIRDYQNEAVAKLQHKNKSILNLPCGMGKTFITSLMAKQYDNIIILSPLRYLALQTLEQYKKYIPDKNYSHILISVDGGRNLEKINSFLKNKNIISLTYDSCDVLLQIIDNLKNVYIVIDEFHNLSYNNINDCNNCIYKIINNECDKIFVSATPITNFMNITDIYQYSWHDAINNKYICDFKIYIPDADENYKFFEDLINKNICNSNVKINVIKKTYFMLKNMLHNGDKKCLCYAPTIQYATEMYEIIIWLSKFLGIACDHWQLDCNTKKTIRENVIKNFKNSLNISIIINVHICDEGINIEKCDSIFIAKPSDNIINIIQRMCRANRITDTKQNCNIYLWCSEKKTKTILNYINENTHNLIKNKVFVLKSNNLQSNVVSSSQIFKPYLFDVNNVLNLNTVEETNDHNFFVQNDIFKNFMIEKSGVPPNVEKDFFKLFECKDYIERYNEFLIDSEILRKWLQINIKRAFNDTIKKSYTKNVDYTIETVKKHNGSGGHNLEVIMLTPEASKKICLSTKSKIGRKVQQYFLDLEFALFKYKNYIIEGMNAKNTLI